MYVDFLFKYKLKVPLRNIPGYTFLRQKHNYTITTSRIHKHASKVLNACILFSNMDYNGKMEDISCLVVYLSIGINANTQPLC